MNKNAKGYPMYNISKFNIQAMNDWNAMFAEKNDTKSKEDRYKNFKQRLEEFKKVTTIEDARALLQKTMPVKLERTVFFIGDAKCTIINKEKRIRISLDSPVEFISYDFA